MMRFDEDKSGSADQGGDSGSGDVGGSDTGSEGGDSGSE